eukprot:scaffold8683_cov19-Prasinocladus_malaysianus.AAC.1
MKHLEAIMPFIELPFKLLMLVLISIDISGVAVYLTIDKRQIKCRANSKYSNSKNYYPNNSV